MLVGALMGGGSGITDIVKYPTQITVPASTGFSIPTTKRAKGFAFYYQSNSNYTYLFSGFEGVNDNKVFSWADGGYASFAATYSDSSISFPSFSSSQRVLSVEIFY